MIKVRKSNKILPHIVSLIVVVKCIFARGNNVENELLKLIMLQKS